MNPKEASSEQKTTREAAWQDFREALNRLHQTNAAAALAYLRGAAGSLRAYAQALERAQEAKRGG